MRRDNSVLVWYRRAVLAAIAIVTCLPALAYCQTDGIALLLQQTPAQGGTVTPEIGVHHFQIYTDVTLTAIPKQGYQFVYWLGDVSEPTVNRTNVYLDGPKIVIAVFERAEYEYIDTEEQPQCSLGSGGLYPSAADYARTGGGGGGGRRLSRPGRAGEPEQEKPEEPEENDFPVPEQEEQEYDFPVPEPIPEPATALLLVIGSLFAIPARPGKRQLC